MTEGLPDKMAQFEAVRRRLKSIAYRMLGSRAEAEDVVQEAWLRWQGANAEALQSAAAWLTTVTTRLAVDRLRTLQREHDYAHALLVVQQWDERFVPSAESLLAEVSDMRFGLMLMLERLSSDERAALVLFEAFDCNYADIAAVLGKSVVACRQLLHRAKKRLRDPAKHPDFTPEHGDETHQEAFEMVERIRDAISNQDQSALIGLMLDDVKAIHAGSDLAPSASHSLKVSKTITSSSEALTANTGAFEIPTGLIPIRELLGAWSERVGAGSTVEVIALGGRPALVLLAGCRIVMAMLHDHQ
jgi:RNA polymerase sigma factor (sigma-70 family)